ncbi:MAG: hypothetical protein HWE26_09715 [Alteromonadaceae bacterium]|nr:hypothetical protein [Alteromonadaceae bacterium]
MDESLKPAFRRLFDAKSHWHKAVDSYFEPNDFRIAINSCIQELRNITFVLQANKREIPGFDSWYGPWQERMRGNPSLRWLVDARNYIVKRGDLELLSKLRIEVIGSYLAGEVKIFEEDYNPNLTNAEVYAKTVSLGLPVEVFENSYVKLQRRWIDKNYPNHELGELLSECWSAVAGLLYDAPNSDASKDRGSSTPKLPPCMHEQLEMRSILMKVCGKTLVPAVIGSESVSLDESDRASIEEKYGDTPLFREKGETGSLTSKSFKEQCEFFFEQAKCVLQKDGYHIHLAMIFVGKTLAEIIEIRNEDKADKYMTMRNLASTVERIGADSFIMVSEAWGAKFDPMNPYRGAAEAPSRQEVLMLVGATNEGDSYCFSAPFFRDGEVISFGDQEIMDATTMNAIQPILAIWSK